MGEWQAQTGAPPLCSHGSTESSALGCTVAHTRFSTLLPEFHHRPPPGRAAVKDLGNQGRPWKVGAPMTRSGPWKPHHQPVVSIGSSSLGQVGPT